MSSYGDRKRKAASVSKDETDMSPRLTKELKAPPRTTTSNEGAREQGSPGFLHLPAGVVAKVAQFIGIADENDDGLTKGSLTLMALCVAVGREVARVIRREYLHNNLDNLNYLWGNVQIKQKMARKYTIDNSTFLTVLKASLQQWMEENDWWKDACRDTFLFAQGGEVRTNYPSICKTIVFPNFPNESERVDYLMNDVGVDGSGKVDMSSNEGPICDDYSIVLAIDDVDLEGMIFTEVFDLLVEEGSKVLRVMLKSFSWLLLNPALRETLTVS